MTDLPSRVPEDELSRLEKEATDFRVTGVRLELTGYCRSCDPGATVRA